MVLTLTSVEQIKWTIKVVLPPKHHATKCRGKGGQSPDILFNGTWWWWDVKPYVIFFLSLGKNFYYWFVRISMYVDSEKEILKLKRWYSYVFENTTEIFRSQLCFFLRWKNREARIPLVPKNRAEWSRWSCLWRESNISLVTEFVRNFKRRIV
jgi:hypothetical protein